MSRIIRRALLLALSFFFFVLAVSLGVKGQTVAPHCLPSLLTVVSSGVAPAFPSLDFVLWQSSLDITAKFIPPKLVSWAQPYELRISGAPREAFSSHLNSFSTLKATQHATTALESRVAPPVLSLFSTADTNRLSCSSGVTLPVSSPTSNTTASALPPRSHNSTSPSAPLLATNPGWYETPTRNWTDADKRYTLHAFFLATLVFSALPVVLHYDTAFLHAAAVDYAASKQRIATLIDHCHVTIVWTEAQLTSFSKTLDRVGQAVVRSVRFVGLLDRDIVSIGFSIEDHSLPPWPDFGEPDAEWPPSRRKARSRSYDSPYMDSPFISLPWAEHRRTETISTQSSRTSTPSPDQKPLLPPSSHSLSPLPPNANPKTRAAVSKGPIPYRLPDLTTEQLVLPKVWGFGNIPTEEWFDDDLPREVKPYPWELPPVFVDEDEEELERLSKGYENDRLFILFEANPKLLKRYLLDPQGFRDALPPPKKEDDSWKLRDTSDYIIPRLPKMDRPFHKSSKPASAEQSIKKSEVAKKQGGRSAPAKTSPTSEAGASRSDQQTAAGESTKGARSWLGGASKIKPTPRKILSTVKGRRFGFVLQPKDKTRTDAGF